jgi:hypothetical protein
MSWHYFASLVETCPVLGLPDPVLLQHLFVGLLEDSAMRLDALSGGAFVFLKPDKERKFWEISKISIPYLPQVARQPNR